MTFAPLMASTGWTVLAMGAAVVTGLAGFAAGRWACRRGPSTKPLLAAECAGSAVLVTSRQGCVEWANLAFSGLSGLTAPEISGKPIASLLLGSAQGSKTAHRIKDGLDAGQAFSLEMPFVHRNGHRSWLYLSFAPVLNRRNKPASFVVVATEITAARRAHEELARVNRHHELLLNALPDGVYSTDPQGNISFINPAAARLTGWAPGELVGKSASVILHQIRLARSGGSQDGQCLPAPVNDGSVLMGDTDFFRRKDGSIFPVDYLSGQLQEGNQPAGAVVVFRNISERKEAENRHAQQARQSTLRADLAFALAANGGLSGVLERCAQAILKCFDGAFVRVWTLNSHENLLELQASVGLYTHLNGPHARIPVGDSRIGKIARERMPHLTNQLGSDPDLSDPAWAQREKLTGFAGFPLMAQGQLVGVAAVFSRDALPDDTLEMLGCIADSVAHGIVRKQAEETIREQAALLDKAQDAILLLDLSGHVSYWNRSAERLYGWAAKEVHGQKVVALLYRSPSLFERAKAATLEQGGWHGECRQVNRSGDAITVESQWTLVQDDAGKPKSILIVNTDISEKKRIESQFLRTQRMESVGTLAGGIAHDLNNILAPIMMSVEILKEKVRDDQSRRMLSILETSAKRGADMVRQVLTFSRGVDGERMLLQSRHLIKEVAKMLGETFPKSIQIRTRLPENLWPIMGDATQLHQVLVNLAVNARDAMPGGGSLGITAENTAVEPGQVPPNVIPKNSHPPPGFYVLIKVTDTGTGIAREILDRIFEPFYTTKEVGKGTGLGLPTVLSIVRSHGGFLQVQTEVRAGTTFLVYLPAKEQPLHGARENPRQQLPAGHGETILAVDDEAAVLSMTKETLESFGYRVLTAKDGTEAISAFSAHRREIKGVLTDIIMPFMDGPATIRALKRLDPGIKIIAASGLLDGDKIKDATGMENISFLMKPYTAEKLLTTIDKMLCDAN
jgi:PAS domain S-box-containing protein